MSNIYSFKKAHMVCIRRVEPRGSTSFERNQMSKRTYFVDIIPEQAEYEIPFPIKRLLSIHIHNSTTSVWELIFNRLVRSDRPTYSIRGNTIILDPAPYNISEMRVLVDA